MSRITDLTDGSETHEILTQTSTGGLIGGGKLLGGEPLASYLEDDEEPNYVLRNKKSGVKIEGETGTRRIEPNDEYQAVALVTDVRILFVAGRAFEDESEELPLTEIVEARAQTGRIRTSKLILTTLADETWTFPCRSDTTEVAAHVDEMAHVWANAGRLLDEVETQIEAAQAPLEKKDYDSARAELDGTEEKMRTAKRRIREIGQGAAARIDQRAATLSETLATLRRKVDAAEGATAHAKAQNAWDAGNYEAGATAYEAAIDAYERALETEGPSPDDGTLRRRLTGAVRERELLRIGPLVDADAARRRAAKIDDPEKAATKWKEALDGYRELLGLDWGSEEGTFVVDKGTIREQTTEIADDAIEDHHEAGRKWLNSGDKLAVQGRKEQAREVYERAKEQFEQAHKLAREVQPEHLDTLEDALATVEDRLSGTVPDELPEEEPLSTDAISGLKAERRDATSEKPEAEATTVEKTADSETTVPDESVGTRADQTDHASTADSDPRDDEIDDSSIIGQIRSQKTREKRASSANENPEQTSTEARERPSGDTDTSGATADSDTSGATADSDTSGATADPQTDTTPPEELTDQQLKVRLARLDEDEFTALVAELWEAQGWSTTVFSATAKAVYDIVAMRETPEEERLLVWTEHAPDGGVGADVVKKCATARESSQGADSATLVTSGPVTTGAQTRADELDVDIVDGEELLQLLRFEELVDELVSGDF